RLADGMQAILENVVVTAKFTDSAYVEAQDRSAGIKVTANALPDENALVTVTGTLRTDANGERYLVADTVTPQGTASIEPLGITTRPLFGGDNLYDSASGAGQRGVTGGAGLNPVGLLTRTLGRVTTVENGAFHLSDGYGVAVKAFLPAGATPPQPGA